MHSHGATNNAQIATRVAVHKRRLLRQIGLRQSDIDSVGRGYLELYCRTASKIDLLDAYFQEHGLVKADGTVQDGTAFYVSLVNSCRLALQRLELHLRSDVEVDEIYEKYRPDRWGRDNESEESA